MQSTISFREKHFPALDGLRGLAALMVVLHHSAFSYPLTSTFDKAYLRATSLLWIGVDLFFVLSGFLITNILIETKESRNYLPTFYARRFLRIFPLYYAFLAVLYFLLPALGSVLPASLTSVQAWQWTYTSNFYIGFHGWPNENINHLWTLAIEEQFYLLWPFAVLVAGRKTLKESVIVLLLLMPIVRAVCLWSGLSTYFIYTFTLCHMDGLLFGALISILAHDGLLEKMRTPRIAAWIPKLDWAVASIVFGLIVFYCVGLRNDQFQFNILTWSAYGQCVGLSLISLPLAYAVLRCISTDANPLQRIVQVPMLRSAGKYSYALYLLHAPICFWAGLHFPIPDVLRSLPVQWSFLTSIYIVIVEVVLSIAAAVISWNILEKHFLKLKKYFSYRTTLPRDRTFEHLAVPLGEDIG